ncbi:hypothetical protein V6N13_133408 [Hibiscus sabdariffa]
MRSEGLKGLGKARDSMGIAVMVEVWRLPLCLASYRQPLNFNNSNSNSSNVRWDCSSSISTSRAGLN